MSDSSRDIAIVGLGCVFPGAANLQQYWENIIGKVDAVSDAPPDWEAELFYDPDAPTDDKTYCRRGGFLGELSRFDPTEYGVMPNAVDGTEPDHFLALRAASDALRDAGYAEIGKLRERTEIIIGRGSYVNRGNTTAIQHGVVLDSVLRVLKQLHPEYSDEELRIIRAELKKSLPPFHAGTAPGLVPNVITGRIANRLDLMGTNYIVDAACASSLVAVELAANDLIDGRCDMAVAGGVHASTPPVIMIIFSQLKALSRKGMIRPFDADADGTLLGEGVGMAVLKRVADAERDGDRIYALLKGVGTASDGRAIGLLAPRLEGEELALRRAYSNARVDPGTVDLIEAHGTATGVGDAVEFQALSNVFGPRELGAPTVAVGSVKSMISHTMPASGMAGLIKAALALHHRVLPPTLHCDNPNPKLELSSSRFYLNTETRPWLHGALAHPRRAGVNAFGFGGINAHAVLEEYTGPNAAPWLQHRWDSELFVLSAASREALVEEGTRVLALARHPQCSLKDLAYTVNCAQGDPGPVRCAIIASSPADLAVKLERMTGKLSQPRTKRIRDNEGIYFFEQPLGRDSKIAFMFPGEGAQYENMLADLCLHFPLVREVFDRMERIYDGHPRGYRLKDALYPPTQPGLTEKPADRLWQMMDLAVEGVFTADLALYELLRHLGVKPDAMVGHSTGENAALIASGIVETTDEEEFRRHVLGVNAVFEQLKANDQVPGGILLTVAGIEREKLEQVVESTGGQAHVALSNCPHQIVVCGTEEGIDRVQQGLTGYPVITQKLPWARAYHTPWFEVFTEPTLNYFRTVGIAAPETPLYSCTTAGLYPEDADQVRYFASVQWARCVKFQETVLQMYEDGVRVFVEVGPRGSLTGFVEDTLRGKSFLASPSNVPHRSGIEQLNHLLGQLAAHGVPFDLEKLYAHRAPKQVHAASESKPRRTMKISGGLQPARLPEGFQLPGANGRKSPAAAAPVAPPPVSPASPGQPALALMGSREAALAGHLETMQKFLELQQSVFSGSAASARRPAAIAPEAASVAAPEALPAAAPSALPPFLTEIVSRPDVGKVIARSVFSLSRDRHVMDHLLGRLVSDDDPNLTALPVVPLTAFVETLAECGSLLEPGRVLTDVHDFRLTRWVTLDAGDVTMELEAERIVPGQVRVRMRQEGPASALRPLLAECTLTFADRYPAAPVAEPFPLTAERASRWDPKAIYWDGMFHGPIFQAVKTMDRVGREGATASMVVLPFDTMLAGVPRPALLTDPLLLDGAGQALSLFIQETSDSTGDLFPYRIQRLTCYGPPATPPGTPVECRVEVPHLGEKDCRANYDMIAGGRSIYRVEGWEDRRFPHTQGFRNLRRNPRDGYVSEVWPEPVASLPKGTRALACRMNQMAEEFLHSSHGIWMKVLTHLVLSASERREWSSMEATPTRRVEWLMGRIVAKDAVRRLIERERKVQLCPADITIGNDGFGKPVVSGAWSSRLGVHPSVSITHSGGVAAAIASWDAGRLGIDLQSASLEPGWEDLALTQSERDSLKSQPAGSQWALRLWSAKEAAAKAAGRGLRHGLHSLEALRYGLDGGSVEILAKGPLLEELPSLNGVVLRAFTGTESAFVWAVVCQHEETAS